VPIKNLASVGGGFFGANSAHPFENPDAGADFWTCVAILLFPCAAFVAYGRMLNNRRHAAVLYAVALVLLLGMIGWTVYWDALKPNPGLAGLPVDQDTGNLEGKELRFGAAAGPTFAAVTTAVSCGSVNCTHDSLNPLAGLAPMVGMWLGCVIGGKGVGLLNLLQYLMVGLFLTGLMVGRTPEYLGKKLGAREMKLAMIALLIHPLLILAPTGLFAALDWGRQSESNPGAHGLSQVLYEFSSASSGNGSGFEGLGDTWGFNRPADNLNAPAPVSPQWDVAAGLVMLLGRFVPIIAMVALAGGLSAKLPTPFTVGTMRTDTVTFGFIVLGAVLLLGALLFLPAAVLGPVAEHLGPTPFGR
jgi:K+-transporting ATPase ATPase A chain